MWRLTFYDRMQSIGIYGLHLRRLHHPDLAPRFPVLAVLIEKQNKNKM